MSVLRINKTKDYTVMSNVHLKEKEMSLKAKGLLSQMLSLPENWDYSIAGLVAINKENESAIKSTLNELKKFGYLVVTKKMPNESRSGRIEYIYDIYEQPIEKQEQEKQGLENQWVVFQGVENQRQLNTNKSNTNQLITNNTNSVSQSQIENEFETLWELYPRKVSKKEALKCYIRARKNGVDYDIVKRGIDNYNQFIRQNGVKKEYIKHGSTWFNQECWNDDYTTNKELKTSYSIDDIKKKMNKFD